MRSSIIRPHGTEVSCATYLYDMTCDSCGGKVRALIWVGTAPKAHMVMTRIAFCLRCAKDIERDINESIGSAITPSPAPISS